MSLPTTEKAGAQPGEKTSGAGALPGPVSEPGVAVLPEERAVEANNPQIVTSTESQTNSGQSVDISGEHAPNKEHHAGVGVGTTEWSGGEETGVALSPDEKNLRGDESKSGKLPTKGVKGGWPMRGAQGGIGTLSWAGSDSSIAKLPDEKNAADGSPKGRASPTRDPEVSFLESTRSGGEQNFPANSWLAAQPTVRTQARTHPLGGKGATWIGVPLDEAYQCASDDDPEDVSCAGDERNQTHLHHLFSNCKST